jgi:hypothetical protein
LGPIDIKYHAISLAAMFLALGVGIVVGSSTNFLGINSILDRQNRVIDRLEANYNQIRKEVRETRDQLTASQDYTKELEEKLVPQLLAGRLDGLSFGVAIVGDLPAGVSSEDDVLAPAKTSGAQIAYKLRISLDRLRQLGDENPGEFVPQIGKELLRGKAFGSVYTSQFLKDGTAASGNFDQPVAGIIFILGAGLDANSVRDQLLPIEKIIQENKGVTINAAFGQKDEYGQIFRSANVPFLLNLETLRGQVDVVKTLGDFYKQQQGLKKNGA